jgi:hypothetical protein
VRHVFWDLYNSVQACARVSGYWLPVVRIQSVFCKEKPHKQALWQNYGDKIGILSIAELFIIQIILSVRFLACYTLYQSVNLFWYIAGKSKSAPASKQNLYY